MSLIIVASVILLIGILCVITVAIMCTCIRRRQKFQALSYQLEYSTSLNDEQDSFFMGRTNSITPISSQQNAMDTSFDNSDEWEIPPKSVIILKRLGEGCFGEVFKGEIRGFKNIHLTSYQSRHVNSHFAIKVLKKNAASHEKNEFLKEIELMKVIAQGHNPHVVNMIAAVTRQEPMCVVTEFLEHGDLLSYLKKSKGVMSFPDESFDKKNGYIQEKHPESMDLISFAYQISSGMEYLSSLKIIHRDLACRNILVGEGKLLKVSDFGLSRNVTYDSAYVKSTNGPLPIRWMAIESIMYHEFTTASDVWSFGITLWEIGTLGAIPYPNVENSDILRLLQSGQRIDKPKHVSDEIYQLMLECCNENSSYRPSFSTLRKTFDEMLSKHKNPSDMYLDLNVKPEKMSPIHNNSPMNMINKRPSSNMYVDNLAVYSSQENTPTNAIGIGHFSNSPSTVEYVSSNSFPVTSSNFLDVPPFN